MEISYSCNFARYNDDKEEGYKDDIAFIFEFDSEEKVVREMYYNIFSPFLILPLKTISTLERIAGLKGE